MDYEIVFGNFLVGFFTAMAAATVAGMLAEAFWFAFINALMVGGLAASREFLYEKDRIIPKILEKGLIF